MLILLLMLLFALNAAMALARSSYCFPASFKFYVTAKEIG